MKLPTLPALFFALFVSTAAWAADPAGSGRIVFLDGTAWANDRPAAEGQVLTGAVTLKTGPASEVEVVFGGRNVFRLGASTVARVDFAAMKTITVDRGTFSAVVKQLAQVAGGPGLTLRTPTVAAGVRGTSFHAEFTADRTYFCTCNGAVALDDGNPADALTLANAHHGSRIYTRGADGTVTMAIGGVEGHDDALVEGLGRRIGYVLDWTKPD